jgi:hypothetical protein
MLAYASTKASSFTASYHLRVPDGGKVPVGGVATTAGAALSANDGGATFPAGTKPAGGAPLGGTVVVAVLASGASSAAETRTTATTEIDASTSEERQPSFDFMKVSERGELRRPSSPRAQISTETLGIHGASTKVAGTFEV